MHSDRSLGLYRVINVRVLLLFAIVVVAMHGLRLIMGELSLVRAWDYLEQYVTVRYGDSLLWKEHGFHLWYPLSRGGFSFLTHGDNDLLFGVLGLFLPIHWSYIFHRIVTIFISCLGMYLFVRDLPKIGEVGAALGGLVFAFVVNIIYEDVFTPAWLPLFFFVSNRAIGSRSLYPTFFAGLLLGFVLYNHVRIGLVQAPLHLVLVLALYYGKRSNMVSALSRLVGIWCIGLVMFTPMLSELWGVLPTATRNTWGDTHVQDFGAAAISFLRPLTYLTYFSQVGIIPFIGFLVTVTLANKPREVRALLWVILTMVLTTYFVYPLLTVWSWFDQVRTLRNLAYIINSLPVFFIPVAIWGLVQLAHGIAQPTWFRYMRKRPKLTCLLIIIITSTQLYRTALAWNISWSTGQFYFLYAISYISVVIIIMLLIINRRLDLRLNDFSKWFSNTAKLSRSALPFFCVCILDSWFQTLRFAAVNVLAMSSFQAVSSPAYEYIASQSNPRFAKTAVVWQTAVQSVAPPRYGIPTINGYSSVVSDQYARFWMALIDPVMDRSEELRNDYLSYPRRLPLYWNSDDIEDGGNIDSIVYRPLLNMMGTEYVSSGRIINDSDSYNLTFIDIGNTEISSVPLWATLGRRLVGLPHKTKPPFWQEVYLYRNEDVFPEAWIAFDTAVFSDTGALLEGMTTASNTDLREKAYLLASEIEDLSLDNSLEQATGSVVIEAYHPDRIEFDVDVSQAGILVYPDNNSSGWMVEINGKQSELLTVYGTFKGVIVPKGSSEVIMYYRPEFTLFAMKVALSLALAIIFWGLGILMLSKFRKHTHFVS
ncbi:MAG: hypothetical protein CL606_00915 [Anaerolineaceae bacterium]|nr:hypothetical protein [Anaerolineaceae bacterium]